MTIEPKEKIKEQKQAENPLVRSVTSPEFLSASVLTLCHNFEEEQVVDMVSELQRQSAAVCGDDLSRLESMLTAQAHTLDGLFAKMASKSVTAGNVELMTCPASTESGESHHSNSGRNQTAQTVCLRAAGQYRQSGSGQ